MGGVQAGELETLEGSLGEVGIGTLGADRIISVRSRYAPGLRWSGRWETTPHAARCDAARNRCNVALVCKWQNSFGSAEGWHGPSVPCAAKWHRQTACCPISPTSSPGAGRSEPVTKALEAMSKHSISGVPVVDDDGRFIGVFSDEGVGPARLGGASVKWGGAVAIS